MKVYRLPTSHVHIWQYAYSQAALDIIEQLFSLTRAEQDQAYRFHFQHDQQRFVQGRYLLKSVLAKYLRRTVEQIKFRYNAYGKPELEANDQLFFNISHSADRLVIALCRQAAVGIDVEQMTDKVAHDLRTADIFTSQELQYLQASSPEEQHRLIYQLWVCKEAYLKARGMGLSIELNTIEVINCNGFARIVDHNDQNNQPDYYCYDLFELSPGYLGAIAIAIQPVIIKYCNQILS